MFRLNLILVCAIIAPLVTFGPNPERVATDSPVRMSLVQYPMEGDLSAEDIVAKVEEYVIEAVEAKSQCVVFPELIALDAWRMEQVEMHAEPTDEEVQEVRRIANEVTPEIWKRSAELAVKHKIAILAGSLPRCWATRFTTRQHCSSAMVRVCCKISCTPPAGKLR
ncbi:MAG: nitrilase-related carbon-nitrogen hydrolase [Pirellulaceae bacterium]